MVKHTNYGGGPASTSTRRTGATLARASHGDAFGTAREMRLPMKGDKFEHIPSRTSYQVAKVERSGLTVSRVHYKPIGAGAEAPLKSMSGQKWAGLHKKGLIHHWSGADAKFVDKDSSMYGRARSQNRRGVQMRPETSGIDPAARKSEDIDAWDIVKAKQVVAGGKLDELWTQKNKMKPKAPSQKGKVTVRPTEFEFHLPFFDKRLRDVVQAIPGSELAGDDTWTAPINGANMAEVAKLIHNKDFYLVDWIELERDPAIQKERAPNSWGAVGTNDHGIMKQDGPRKGRGTGAEIAAGKSQEESATDLVKGLRDVLLAPTPVAEEDAPIVKSKRHKKHHHPQGSKPCTHCGGVGYVFDRNHNNTNDDHDPEGNEPMGDDDDGTTGKGGDVANAAAVTAKSVQSDSAMTLLGKSLGMIEGEPVLVAIDTPDAPAPETLPVVIETVEVAKSLASGKVCHSCQLTEGEGRTFNNNPIGSYCDFCLSL